MTVASDLKFSVSLPSASPVLLLAFVGSAVPFSNTASTFTVLDVSLSSVKVVAAVEATFDVSLTKVTLSPPFELTLAKAVPPLANNPIPTNNVAPISFESVRPSLYFLKENFSFLLFFNITFPLHSF